MSQKPPPPVRRFPPPWRVVETPGGYCVEDKGGQKVAWFYGRADLASARAAWVLTKEEARRMAVNVARLPELLAAEKEG